MNPLQMLLKASKETEFLGLFRHSVRTPEAWLHAEDPYKVPWMIDTAVLKVAAELADDYVRFAIEFMGSKFGRWTGDELEGTEFPTEDYIVEVIRRQMTDFRRTK